MTSTFVVINGDIQCDCGNDPTYIGFYTCDANGARNETSTWDGVHYRCAKCGAVHAPQFPSDTDHTDPEGKLTMPNAEIVEGDIFIIHRNGYTTCVSLLDVTDNAGLPAVGTPPELAAKVAQIMTGRQGLVFVSDETQVVDGWELTYVSKESLG